MTPPAALAAAVRSPPEEEAGGRKGDDGDGCDGDPDLPLPVGGRRVGRKDRRGRRGLLGQSERDVPSRLESTVAVLFEAMLDDVVESGRDVSPGRRKLRRLLCQDRDDRVARRGPLERALAREHLVQDRSERKDVRAVIDGESPHLLGRHVAQRPQHHAGLRVGGTCRPAGLVVRRNHLDPLREAEVQDLEMPVLVDEQVLGLQVPVDDALLVGGGEAPGNLDRVVDRLLRREGPRLEFLAQRFAFQKLHDGIGDAVLRPEVEDREDVRMRERRDRLRLALEPGQRLGIGRDGERQDLDRHVPVELLIPSPVHLSHAARADRRKDFVGAEARTGRECHGMAVPSTLPHRGNGWAVCQLVPTRPCNGKKGGSNRKAPPLAVGEGWLAGNLGSLLRLDHLKVELPSPSRKNMHSDAASHFVVCL